MPMDFACLIVMGALFHNLVASPMKVSLDLGSMKFSDVTLLVTLVSFVGFILSNLIGKNEHGQLFAQAYNSMA